MHNLFPLTRQQIESICNHFPGIPEDYLEFLAECGWGDMGMFLCNGPIKANEIYHYEELREEDPPEYEKMEQTWLIGDYGMGDAFGYWIHKGIFILLILTMNASIGGAFRRLPVIFGFVVCPGDRGIVQFG